MDPCEHSCEVSAPAPCSSSNRRSKKERLALKRKIARGRRTKSQTLVAHARRAGFEGLLASSRGRDQSVNLLHTRDVRRLAQYRPLDLQNSGLSAAECEERAVLTKAIIGEAALEAALPHVEHLLRHLLDASVGQCLDGGRNRLRPSTLLEAMRWMVSTTRYATLVPPPASTRGREVVPADVVKDVGEVGNLAGYAITSDDEETVVFGV